MPDSHLPITRISQRQIYVTTADEVIVAVAASSLCLCARDTEVGIAGISHFMLHLGKSAVDSLIEQLLLQGGRTENLEFKLYGGADNAASLDAGAQNIAFVSSHLQAEGFRVREQEVGGDFARELHYGAWSGRVRMQPVSARNNERMFLEERELVNRLPISHTPFAIDYSALNSASASR
jgi:chemotaxis protein CheD